MHQSINRHLGVSPVGSVMTTGGSLDLPLDTAGIFSKNPRKTTKKGLSAIGDFAGVAKDELLTLMFGTKKDTGKKGSNKNDRTLDFSLRDIKKVGIAHPKNPEQKFDYWRVGWDGIDDNTTFKFHKGQTLEFQMTVGGIAATFFNDVDQYTVRTLINVPNDEADGICEELGDICTPVDCREHTLNMVRNLNDYDLPGGQKLSQFFDIYPIFDTPTSPESTTVYNQYCLDYCGFGGDHELAAVAAQYPGFEVSRDPMTEKFVMMREASEGAPTAYSETVASILKGCEDCPTGFDEIPGGVVYAVAIEDDGEDMTDVIETLGSTSVPGEGEEPPVVTVNAVVTKTGQDFGVGHYVLAIATEIDAAELATFVEDNPTAIVKYVGTTEAFCEDDTVTTHAWEQCGSCETSTAKYRIMVPDDCNGSRLEDLQEAYPDLEITEVIRQNCVAVFETTVETTPSCTEGCNDAIIEQMFNSEPPKPFGINLYWYPVVESTTGEDTGVKCGFEIKGKPIVMNPSEALIDELPFVMTSARIVSLSGGYPVDYSMNSIVPQGTWRLLELDKAVDLDNLGGSASLREWEKKGRFYFSNETPYRNTVSRSLTGSESRLKGLTQYSDVYLTIEKENKAGMMSKEYSFMNYHILVPFGRTTDLEGLFQNLAGAAGVPFEVK